MVICRGELVLRNPTPEELADCLGFNADHRRRASCATSWSSAPGRPGSRPRCTAHPRGSTSWCSRRHAPGGQAGSSSRIENYLGFPTGHLRSGAGRPRVHPGGEVRRQRGDRAPAAKLLLRAAALSPSSCRRATWCTPGRSSSPPARSTGSCRSTKLSTFEGAGVYYAATHMEAQLCAGEEVIVVGGGNSAGQAAVFLVRDRAVTCTCWCAATASAETHVALPRSGASRSSPRITLHTRTEIEALEGDAHLERVRWRDVADGEVETRADPARVPDDRRRAQHRVARRAASRSTTRASSRPAATSRPRS